MGKPVDDFFNDLNAAHARFVGKTVKKDEGYVDLIHPDLKDKAVSGWWTAFLTFNKLNDKDINENIKQYNSNLL